MAIPNGAMYPHVGVVKDSQLHFSVVNFNSHLTTIVQSMIANIEFKLLYSCPNM